MAKKKNPNAVALGRLGGLAGKGVAKPQSAENGKQGGRPKGSGDSKPRERRWKVKPEEK